MAHHGLTDFDAGRITIDQDSPDLLLQHGHKPLVPLQIARFTNQGGRQLAAQ